MRTALFSVTLAALLAVCQSAGAAQDPRPGTADQRIKKVQYNPDDVVVIKGFYGFSTLISFAEYEVITLATVGDSVAWQVEPVGNKLFIKPQEDNASTNMQVVTSHRVYIFELTAEVTSNPRNKEITYLLRFVYPEDAVVAWKKAEKKRVKREESQAAALPKEPASRNLNYTYSGSQRLAPMRVFDDGEFTYFEFRKRADQPAIFYVHSDLRESLVNYRTEGKYVVVERIGRQFTLRHGTEVVCIVNEGFPFQAPKLLPPHAEPDLVKEGSHGRKS